MDNVSPSTTASMNAIVITMHDDIEHYSPRRIYENIILYHEGCNLHRF